MKNCKKQIALMLLAALTLFSLSGCVSQEDLLLTSQPEASDSETSGDTSDLVSEEEVNERELSIDGITLLLPEGWKLQGGTTLTFYPPNYPEDSSNIDIQSIENTAKFDQINQEDYVSAFEKSLRVVDKNIVVTSDTFEQLEVAGKEALKIKVHYELSGVAITQTQYAIKADRLYWIALTEENEEKWGDTFEEVISSIQFQK